MLALDAERDLCGHKLVHSSLDFKNKPVCIGAAIFYLRNRKCGNKEMCQN